MSINIDTTMSWKSIKQKFRVKIIRRVHISWEDDDDWTDIYLEREWKNIMRWACKILTLEDNRYILRCLVIAVLIKKIL